MARKQFRHGGMMLKKEYSPAGKSCKVTFSLSDEDDFDSVVVLGDFNDWEPKNGVMKRKKDGTFTATIALKAGKAYRFRYLINGDRWSNDPEADSTVPNEFGTDDSVVSV
jgi:1,4-alpha-glucan branching enzyme